MWVKGSIDRIDFVEMVGKKRFDCCPWGWQIIILIADWMSNKLETRIKSAAFIRRKHWSEADQLPESQPANQNVVTSLPVSQSRFVSNKERPTAKTLSLSKITISRNNPSSASEIWRKVHTTRSEIKLRSLVGSKMEEQPIMLNLKEKVERIRSKHTEREQEYKNCCYQTQKIIRQRCTSLKKQGDRGELSRRIFDLLAPLQKARQLAQQRYRARLLRLLKQ